MATARWPCLGRGHGPVALLMRFHFSMGAAIFARYGEKMMAAEFPDERINYHVIRNSEEMCAAENLL